MYAGQNGWISEDISLLLTMLWFFSFFFFLFFLFG